MEAEKMKKKTVKSEDRRGKETLQLEAEKLLLEKQRLELMAKTEGDAAKLRNYLVQKAKLFGDAFRNVVSKNAKRQLRVGVLF